MLVTSKRRLAPVPEPQSESLEYGVEVPRATLPAKVEVAVVEVEIKLVT